MNLTARAIEDDRVLLDLAVRVVDKLQLHAVSTVSGRSEQIELTPGVLLFARSVPVSDEGMDELRAQESAWKAIAGDAADPDPPTQARRGSPHRPAVSLRSILRSTTDPSTGSPWFCTTEESRAGRLRCSVLPPELRVLVGSNRATITEASEEVRSGRRRK